MTTAKSFLNRTALSSSAVSVALALAFAATPAMAQTTAAADEASADTIVVTGSRIARRDLDTAAPLAVVSAEEFKLTGSVNVEQVLNALPQVIPGTTSFSNNPGGGVATLNLRGLGSQRNLVLVNGRRWMFYDTAQIADLNTIPQFLIDSVDVVTGGASAIYGSDAIAGVVNFRLKNVEGFEISAQQSLTGRGDGERFNINAAVGGEFAGGKGHVTAYASYYNRKPILQGQRDFSDFTASDSANGLTRTGGSNTTEKGRFAIPGTSVIAPVLPAGARAGDGTLPVFPGFGGDLNNDGTVSAAEAATALTRAGGTTFGSALGATFDSPTSGSRNFLNGPDTFNYAPANYLQVPQERWLLGAYGDYEIAEGVTAYMEASFVNNRVANELAATPVTGNFNVRLSSVAGFLSAADNAALAAIDANEAAINTQLTARCNANNAANAGVPGFTPGNCTAAASLPGAGVVQLGVNRRTNDVGARNTLDERNAFRILLGVKGDIGDTGLTYDGYYSYARTRNANVQAGNISRRAFQAGLDGTAAPIDIFGPGSLSPASAAQIAIIAQNNDISTLEVVNGSVAGSLFNLGLGGDDIGFAFGGEYRTVGSRFIPDTALSSGDVIGFNAGNPTEGSYNVKEVFGELRIPIAADRPFFHKLELTGAGRYSDYSLEAVGGVWTYAGGLEWAPIEDLTLRGQYSRAVRAPNVGELFGGLQTGFPTVTDPCATPAALAAGGLRNTCLATGAPAANIGQGIGSVLQPNTQVQAQFGGNPNLDAERADTYTFGAVLRPSFIPRLTITADYFNINIKNAIATAGGGVANILNLCYNTFQDPTNGFCQLITRNTNTGALDGTVNADGSNSVVFAGAANLSSLKTSGIDLAVDYNIPLAFGLMSEESRFSVSFLGTWTEANTFTPVIGLPDVVECAGRFGNLCGNPQSAYKFTSRFSWQDGPLTTSVRWRYLSSVRDDDDTTDYTVERLDAYSLIDLSFNLDINDQFAMAFGVNNLFDKKPQLIGANQEQANTFPGVYDVLGRDFFISANFRF